MPLSTATVTFDLSDHFGNDYDTRRGIRAWVDTNIPDDTIVDTDGNQVRIGSGKVTVADNGTGSFTVWVPGVGSNPASWQTYLHVEYVPNGFASSRGGNQPRTTRTFGPFTITGNADLADLIEEQEVPPEYAGQIVAQMEGLRDETATDRAFVEARVVDDLGTTDGQTKALIETPSSLTATALSATIARRGVFMGDYPRQGAETTDDAALDRALAYAAANDIRLIIFGAGDFTLSAEHLITQTGLTFAGMGWQTRIVTGTDARILHITGDEFNMRDLTVYTPQVARTNWPIQTDGLRPKFVNVIFQGITNSWRSGVHFAAGNAATVLDCLTNHAGFRVSIFDLKINNTYIQAITAEYGIGLDPGAGNLELTDVDVVPPLTSVASAKAGIYIPGPSFKITFNQVYIDGNGALETREGIYLGDGVAQVHGSVDSNNMASDVVVLDSCYGVDLYVSGQNNNHSGTGSREVVVRQTGAQPVQRIKLRGVGIINAAVTGTTGPAVAVESPVDCSEVSIDFDVIQPAAGGGYSVPELLVHNPNAAHLAGTGTRSKYSAHGSVAVANGDTAVSINLSTPYPMAYRPLPSDINLVWEGTSTRHHSINFTTDNQIYVPFDSPITGAGTLHWRVDLRR